MYVLSVKWHDQSEGLITTKEPVMTNATSTATTLTAQVSTPSNVHYTMSANSGANFQVTPHEPTPR